MARTVGSINKRSQQAAIKLKGRFPDYNPLLELARIAQDPEVDVGVRVQANKEVVKYVYPQLKAVEVTGDDGGPIVASVQVNFSKAPEKAPETPATASEAAPKRKARVVRVKTSGPDGA
jgi:hypothetical protein